MGKPTTNQTSRDPNRKIRAPAKTLIARDLANSSRKDLEAFAFPNSGGRLNNTFARTITSSAAITQSADLKPRIWSSTPLAKKPKPFIAFFEPVNHATQRNSCPAPPSEVALIADFEAVLVMSLATPEMPCAATTHATEKAALQPGSSAD